MKPRLFFLALALTVILSFAVAGVGFYWVLAQSPLALLSGGVQRSPLATVFIPKQAPVMVSLLVNPDRLEAFGELIAQPQNRRRWGKTARRRGLRQRAQTTRQGGRTGRGRGRSPAIA